MDISVEHGFTSLPKSFFRKLPVELSHGARLALAVLCEHAGAKTGKCVLSYRTLGSILRRSKASISSYIRELRTHGLVVTEQTSRFGYKGPCIFTLPFYKSFREALSNRRHKVAVQSSCSPKDQVDGADEAAPGRKQGATLIQEPEHRVRPTERSKTNQNYRNNKSSGPNENNSAKSDTHLQRPISEGEELIARWQQLERGAPYPTFNEPPADELVSRTAQFLVHKTTLQQPEVVSEERIKAELGEMWSRIGIVASEKQLRDHAQIFAAALGANASVNGDFEAAVRRLWKPHWRRPSSPEQFKQIVTSVSYELPSEASVRGVLKRYLRRHTSCVMHPCS